MKLLFLDESGDHSLENIDRDYPVFVLGGIVVDRAYYLEVVEPSIHELTERFFDLPTPILHTSDIIRGKNGFELLSDVVVRNAFYEALNSVMRNLEYTVIACAIRKREFVDQLGVQAIDPYALSLERLVERFCDEIGDVESGGLILAERRRPDLDRELDLTWRMMCERGTAFIDAKRLNTRIVDLSLKDKRLNIAGLQLADLVVSPIGRMMLGKPLREDWGIVRGKIRHRRGGFEGSDLIILPE
jgi:hypothetical protein